MIKTTPISKGRGVAYATCHGSRISTPMIREEDEFRKASREEVLELIRSLSGSSIFRNANSLLSQQRIYI